MEFLEDSYPASYQPPERNQVLWRYMSLAKFAALAVPRSFYGQPHLAALFMPRADMLGDPFEGSAHESCVISERATYGSLTFLSNTMAAFE